MSVGIARLADAKAIEPKARDGRERLIAGARRLLAEKGYAGMELRDVAEVGKAPRGSIYHHFPGGKSQLAVEAAEAEGREIRAAIERSLEERGLGETLTMFGEMFSRRVKDKPERLGPSGVRRLGALYRSAAADLAYARRAFPGDPLVGRLEGLVLRARATVYGRVGRRQSVWQFVSRGYWRRLAERPWFVFAAWALLLVPAALGAIWALADSPSAAGLIPAWRRRVGSSDAADHRSGRRAVL